MKILNLIVAATLGVATLPVAAFAQDTVEARDKPDCTCTTTRTARDALGSFVAANGSVLRSDRSGFVPADAGDSIVNGTEIQVGSDSSAEIRVGTCELSLQANSLTRVSAVENNICVLAQNVGGAPTGTPSWVPAAMFGTLAAGAAGLALTQDSSGQGTRPVSP